MRKHLLPILLTMLFSWLSTTSEAQSFSLSTIGINEGLSSLTTYSIELDSRGMIWIATKQGIDMYNGRIIRHYSLLDNPYRVIEDGHMVRLYQDSQSQMWAYNDAGKIYRYSPVSDRFELFIKLSDHNLVSPLKALTRIGNDLYAGFSDGVARISIPDATIVSAIHHLPQINALDVGAESVIMLGTDRGVYMVDATLKHPHVIETTKDISVESIYYDPVSRQFWLGTNGRGVWLYDREHVRQVGTVDGTVRSIVRYDDTRLLAGFDGQGIYITDNQGQTISPFATEQEEEGRQLSSVTVYDLLVDNGNVWSVSYDGGVSLISVNRDFRWLRDIRLESHTENQARSFCYTGNRLWVAYYQSVMVYDSNFQPQQRLLNGVTGFQAITDDRFGNIWAGGYDIGLYRINGSTLQTERVRTVADKTSLDRIYALYTDTDGDIWVGGLDIPLTRITPTATSFTTQYYDVRQVFSITAVNQRTILAGTAYGFYLIDRQTGEVTSHQTEMWKMTWKGSNLMNGVATTSGRYCWLATDGGGLLYYDTKTDSVKAYTTEDGLPSNYLVSIIPDSNGKLWVTTENGGIFSFNPSSRKVEFFVYRFPGGHLSKFYANASCRLPDGNLLFGGNIGGLMFHPQTAEKTQRSTQIFFTQLSIDGELCSLHDLNTITLPFRHRSMTIDICTNDMYQQSTEQLYYRMRGYIDEWQPIAANGRLQFTQIPPGTYTLEISCHTRNGKQVVRSIGVHAQQVFWLKWYMLLLYALILSALVFLALRVYWDRQEQKESNDRIHFFTNIAHDLNTPLSLVYAPVEKLLQMVERKSGNKTDANEELFLASTAFRHVKYLREMLEKLTEFNKLGFSTQQPRIESVDLCHLLTLNMDHYRNTAGEKDLNFIVDIPSRHVLVNTDPLLLRRIIDNLVTNALKYTKEGSVSVILSEHKQQATLEVSDTGIGIPAKVAKNVFKRHFRADNAVNAQITGTGIGLVYTYKLSEKLGHKLTFKSQEGKGTTFYLSMASVDMPVQQLAAIDDEKEFMSPAAVNTEHGAQSATSIQTTYKPHILIVDDNEELCRFISYVLHQDYKTTAVLSALEAQKELKEQTFDLIISDVMMPGMSGDEFCGQLKSNIETSHIPVILLTAKSDRGSVVTGLSKGADDYITKPFDTEVLMLKIRNLLEARRKYRQYYLARFGAADGGVQVDDERSAVSATGKDNVPATTSLDDAFLERLKKVVYDNIGNSEFSVNDLASEMAASRTLLYEKVRNLLGISPIDLIRSVRMNKAMTMLKSTNLPIKEIAYSCGYSDSRYFSTAFKKQFGLSPSEVR